MKRAQRQELRPSLERVEMWSRRAVMILSERAKTEANVATRLDGLIKRAVDVQSDSRIRWRAIPLTKKDEAALQALVERSSLPRLDVSDQVILTTLAGEHAAQCKSARAVLTARRLMSGRAKKVAGASAASQLDRIVAWGLETDLDAGLQRMTTPVVAIPSTTELNDILRPELGLAEALGTLGSRPVLLRRDELNELHDAVQIITRAAARESQRRTEALTAGNRTRQAHVDLLLRDMPVERLKEATAERLRLGALTDARITTVHGVLTQAHRLQQLAGIGEKTATRMLAAARSLQQHALDETPVRIDIKSRGSEATRLLDALLAWEACRETARATEDIANAKTLETFVGHLDMWATHALLFSAGPATDTELPGVLEGLIRRARAEHPKSSTASNVWDVFATRPADFYAMLSELGFLVEDEKNAHGDLPQEIIDAVRDKRLHVDHLCASLRGYQSFAARFVLVQRKVLIGDEMGLGKTVEALAVLAHLRSTGSHHFLVVCPAAVVTNWIREVAAKTKLTAHRLHGPGRDEAFKNWERRGGVAVTTFETLAWFESLPEAPPRDCVIVDEAHYIKNPFALRSERTTALIDSAPYAVLLTGTPLENRVDEFRNLVGYLRPDLIVDASDMAPTRFRKQVAPAYLRRNQEDVLDELPELIEVDEWLPMSSRDVREYRGAVAAGNFMAMRRAALGAKDSPKIDRLRELVEEAEANGRRVIVFSYFRDVLETVAGSVPGPVFGPLHGGVPAVQRQRMIDDFSAAKHGAVLVAQIIAGGVGLNIQAASVVVICEPQLKPTTEAQAIARAHRMGQLHTVQAHRLLSEDGVDRRVTEILAVKKKVFDEFARVSETAASAPEAMDVTEMELAKQVIADERERLFSPGQ